MNHVIVFATRNRGKQAEIRKVAERFKLAGNIRFPENEYPETAEEHDTFEGNAYQKAKDAADHYAESNNMIFVGDDSGMEIPSLGGAPGVRTRRWGGKRLTDTEFDEYCLLQLEGMDGRDRDAILKSTICMLDKSTKRYFYGVFKGHILKEPRPIRADKEGFPIAALFYVPDADDVLGNIQNDQINRSSTIKTHRELALEELFTYIQSNYEK